MRLSHRISRLFALSFLVCGISVAYGDDSLRVGMTALDLEPEIGIPLAGYGSTQRRLKPIDWQGKYPHSFFFKPSTGVHTPIRSKVMVLEKGGRHLVFISLDMIGVEVRFTRDLARMLKPLGIREEELIISGTHTHSGPGTLSKTLPLNLIATDLYIRKNYEYILHKVTQSVHIALAELEPADLFSSSVTIEGLQRNKFRKMDQEHYNKKASFLLGRSRVTGDWIGGLVNFAIHGGGMPIGLTVYSSDVPGQIELNLEAKLRERNAASARPPVFVFLNGAEGDVAPPDRGIEHVEMIGREFGKQAEPALDPRNLDPVEPTFSVKKRDIWLGIPGSPLKYCVGGILKKSPIPLRAPLVPFMGQVTPITAVKVGKIAMFTWPGEPSTTLGYQLQDLARKHGYENAWVLGLTNDYKAYFTTKSEYFEGAYDSCSSLYNWRGGKRILKQYGKMLKRF